MASGDNLFDLKQTIIELINDLKEGVLTKNVEVGDLMKVEIYFQGLHPEKIMDRAIKHILPHANEIESQDMTFFFNDKDNGIFSALETVMSQDKIYYYKQILTDAERFDEDDEETVWNYFNTILMLVKEYRKYK